MGKATGIIASVGVSLGSFIAGHLAMDSSSLTNAAHQTESAPWSLSALEDVARARKQAAQQTIDPATGRPDPYASMETWVDQVQAQQQTQERGHVTTQPPQGVIR